MKQGNYNEKTLPRGFGHAPNSNPFDHVPDKKGPGGQGKGGPRMAMVAEKSIFLNLKILNCLKKFKNGSVIFEII